MDSFLLLFFLCIFFFYHDCRLTFLHSSRLCFMLFTFIWVFMLLETQPFCFEHNSFSTLVFPLTNDSSHSYHLCSLPSLVNDKPEFISVFIALCGVACVPSYRISFCARGCNSFWQKVDTVWCLYYRLGLFEMTFLFQQFHWTFNTYFIIF